MRYKERFIIFQDQILFSKQKKRKRILRKMTSC